MSMISEQIRKLRNYAETTERAGFLPDFVNSIKGAADTIEDLSAKLSSANMERSTAHYNDNWIPVESGLYPDDLEDVQVTYLGYKDQKPYCNEFAHRENGNWFWATDCVDVKVKIVAWRYNCDPFIG